MAVAAATVTAVALTLFIGGVDTTRREPVLPVPFVAVPHPTDSTVPTSAYPPAGSLPPPGPTSRTSELPTRPAEQSPDTSAPSTTTTGTPTAIPDREPDVSRPAISDGRIERPRIFTAPRGTCGDKPTTSTVTATITAPAGVSAGSVHLRRHGQDHFSFPMTNTAGTSSWHTEIHGLEGRNAAGGYSVLVEAVGADGLRQVTKIGTICVSGCRAFRPDGDSGT